MKPWERYGSPNTAPSDEESGPWTKYQAKAPQAPEAPKEDTWADKGGRLVGDLGKRVGSVVETMGDLDLPLTDQSLGEFVGGAPSGRRQLTIPEAAAQNVGTTIGAVGDAGYAAIEAAVPDSLRVQEKFGEAVAYVSKTKGGAAAFEALKKGVLSWEDYAKAYPQNAKTLMSVGNIATLIPGIRGVVNKGTAGVVHRAIGQGVETAGKAVAEQGVKQTTKRIATKLLGPDGSVDPSGKGKTKPGPGGVGTKYEPTKQELKVAEVMEEVGVNPDKPLNTNVAKLDEAIESTEKQLQARLKGIKNPPKLHTSIIEKLDSIIPTKENPKAYRGVGAGSEGLGSHKSLMEDMVAKAKNILDDFPDTPAGINEARRKIDREFKTKFGMDAAAEAKDTIGRYIRSALNDAVDSVDPGIKELRSGKLSHLISGREIIGKKAAKKAEGLVAALNDTMRKYHIPFTATAALSLILSGPGQIAVGGLATGLALKAGAKKTMGSKARAEIGKALAAVGKRMKSGEATGVELAELTAARSSLLELMSMIPKGGMEEEEEK